MSKRQFVIITRFSVLYILARIIFSFEHRKNWTYYFDFYNKSNGWLWELFVRIISREAMAKWITISFRCLGADVQAVPHASAVPDYHLLQVKVQADMVTYLDGYHEQCINHYSNGVFSFLGHKSAHSYLLKTIGDRIWHILENIRVLQTLTCESVGLIVEKGEFPAILLNSICEQENVTMLHRRYYACHVVPVFCVLSMKTLVNIIRIFTRTKNTGNDGEGCVVAAEYVDPACNSGFASEPNYLQDNITNIIISYVRHGRKRLGFSENFSLPNREEVVHLGDLQLYWPDLKMVLFCYGKLIKEAWQRPCSPHYTVTLVEQLQLFMELSALFRRYNIDVHVYNTFANGRCVGVRVDSGVVTGVCRRFDVVSVSYQTRVMYLQDFRFCYDVFDIFFVWGDAWVNDFRQRNFIRNIEISGNVFLDAYDEPVNEKSNPKKLLLFTSDIERFFPQHHTLEYVISFMVNVFNALDCLQKQLGYSPYQLIWKPKDPGHANFLLSQPMIREVIQNSSVVLEVVSAERHDINQVINHSDVVLSIGFTTPGMDALLLRKPAVFYSPYRHHYVDVFSKNSKLVIHDVKETVDFLLDLPIDHELIYHLGGEVVRPAKDVMLDYIYDYLLPG